MTPDEHLTIGGAVYVLYNISGTHSVKAALNARIYIIINIIQ
jgi:hypothetical protein